MMSAGVWQLDFFFKDGGKLFINTSISIWEEASWLIYFTSEIVFSSKITQTQKIMLTNPKITLAFF